VDSGAGDLRHDLGWRRKWPDPWPTTDAEVHLWRINDPYDFLQTRADVVAQLFDRDSYSIDGIALAMVLLGSLSYYRFKYLKPKRAKDQERFRRLLGEHVSTFVNRMSIPEMLRQARRTAKRANLEEAILLRFPVLGNFRARQVQEDPVPSEFLHWADDSKLEIPVEMLEMDYAGCIFKFYRNAVIHSLEVANGREALYHHASLNDERIFYSNHSGTRSVKSQAIEESIDTDPIEYMRFGVVPSYLLSVAREAIESVRTWALGKGRNIFDPAEDLPEVDGSQARGTAQERSDDKSGDRPDPDMLAILDAHLHDLHAFEQAIKSEDDLGAIIRGHLYAETALNELLRKNLRHSSVARKFTFDQKADLVRALGLVSHQMRIMLRQLGVLRNRFAHNLNYILNEQDVLACKVAMKGRAFVELRVAPVDPMTGGEIVRAFMSVLRTELNILAYARDYKKSGYFD
jgi:hypothetical protein